MKKINVNMQKIWLEMKIIGLWFFERFCCRKFIFASEGMKMKIHDLRNGIEWNGIEWNRIGLNGMVKPFW